MNQALRLVLSHILFSRNAAFGQSTAATARTLKDADPATRAAFHDTVTAGAHLQGKGKASGVGKVEDNEATETETSETEATEAPESGATVSASAKLKAKAKSGSK